MKRIALLLGGALFLAACQQEVISRRDSLSAQFAQMNKMGWTVDDQGRPRPPQQQADPNVRVIHQADFSAYQFHTNFQVDDPAMGNPAMAPATAPNSSPQPGGSPFGAVPVAPR